MKSNQIMVLRHKMEWLCFRHHLHFQWHFSFFKKYIFYWLWYYSCPIFFSLLFLSALYLPPPPPPSFPQISSCPWVIHIGSLASPFPILFLTSPCLFCTYCLCFLFPVPFSHLPSLLITFHVISVSVNLFLFYLFT